MAKIKVQNIHKTAVKYGGQRFETGDTLTIEEAHFNDALFAKLEKQPRKKAVDADGNDN